jgi:catechol 2,3-dioxygenase-like lactoylglutathione lyase family enzyme
MLKDADVVAFVATRDAAQARAFYGEVLGLPLVHEDEFALVYDAHGTMLRVSLAGEFTPQPFTVLGWSVPDAPAAVRELRRRGVEPVRYDWFEQDELGIWSAPDGSQVAWFKDPDGNLLSVAQHAG